jgi:membrane-associated protein
VPIIRTFAPFVAGVGSMSYSRFASYNVIGGILWIVLFLFAGYFFGSIDFVKNNFSLVILGIILVSIMPPIFSYVNERRKQKKSLEKAVNE